MSKKVESVSFLDVLVFRDDNIWCTKTYDEREHLPLSRIDQKKYPHPSSFLSVRSKYGIITSRMSCFGRVNIRKKGFIERRRLFIKEFRDRGYPLKEIRNFAGRFLKEIHCILSWMEFWVNSLRIFCDLIFCIFIILIYIFIFT